ncbi:alkaline phosphatase PhoX [Actinopolymorpha pittospori]
MSDSAKLSRRSFVLAGGAAAALCVVDPTALAANAKAAGTLDPVDLMGPLGPVPDARDGVPRLVLPKGFGYRSFGIAGTTLDDGNICPSQHDGSGVFSLGDGHLRMIRNHEVDDASIDAKPLAGGHNAYDKRAGGGTTTVDMRVHRDGTVDVIREFVSLNGTHTNCSGGRTPWGSWLSCEETIEDDRPFVVNEENDEFQNGFERRHGYVFEVPATANGPVDPVPLFAMGRFIHEAVAIDPYSGACYMTEDADQAGFYRFEPDRPGHLAEGGVLQALRVRKSPGIDLRGGVAPGSRFEVDWVTIEDPDPPAGETYEDAAYGVYRQGAAQGAATFTGLEGCTWQGRGRTRGSAVFVSTAGGAAKCGQVWAYHPDNRGHGKAETGVLELLYESPGIDVLSYPDALTASNRGSLVIAEDGPGTVLLRGITPRGEIFPIAHAVDMVNDVTGPTFSPDGKVLFFNLMGEDPPYEPGMSFAVWGPWPKYT